MKVRGNCPMGCGETLIGAQVGGSGWVTCANVDCPNPAAVIELLSQPGIAQHGVRFGRDGYAATHPLHERLEDAVMGCDLDTYLQDTYARRLRIWPTGNGVHLAERAQDGLWTFTPAPRERPELQATDLDSYPGRPVGTAHPDHQPIVPAAGGVPPRCSCGVIGGDGVTKPLLADHLREHDPDYGQTASSQAPRPLRVMEAHRLADCAAPRTCWYEPHRSLQAGVENAAES